MSHLLLFSALLMFFFGCKLPENSTEGVPDDDALFKKTFVTEAIDANYEEEDVLDYIKNGKTTKFSTQEEVLLETRNLWEEFKEDKGFRDKIKNADETVLNGIDKFALYLFHKLGDIKIGDELILSRSVLEESMKRKDPAVENNQEDSALSNENNGLAKSSTSWSHDWGTAPPSNVFQNFHPYKTEAESFRESFFVGWIGGLTQFKKYRERFWVWAWWDTDADHIGVTVTYGMNPPVVNSFMNKSFFIKTETDVNSHDDYVSERDFGYELGFATIFWDASGNPSFGPPPGSYFSMNPNMWDAVLTAHKVVHAGYTWNLITSKNMRPVAYYHNTYWGWPF